MLRDIVSAGEELAAKLGPAGFTALRPVLATNAGIDEMLVGNATLRKDEWERIDERVNEVLRERLTVADDLRAAGLVTPVSIGTILRVTERLNAQDEASISFDGDTAPQKDRADFAKDTVPVPVVSFDFTIGWRQLEASRTRGDPLDTTMAEAATRRVRDKLQALITNGHTGGPGGFVIPGLTTATNRRTVTLATAWDASGGDPVGDTIKMLEAAYGVNLFGPFHLYLPKNYWAFVQQDYSTQKGDRTFLERLMAFSDISAVRPLDALADDNVVLVQMTRDAIDLSEAQAPTSVQWEKNPFVTNFRVLTVAGPQIKNIVTEDGVLTHGIVHLS